MEEEKTKKKRKKSAAEGDSGEKEHKPNWREVYASVGEIKAFLSDYIYLRHNVVKRWVEARLPQEDAFCGNTELAQFVSDDWQPMSDRLSNTLLAALRPLHGTHAACGLVLRNRQ